MLWSDYVASAKTRLYKQTKEWTDDNGRVHLLWTGAISGQGYGYISFMYKSTRVHRVAWIIEHGLIPDNLHVLHECDVRLCVDCSHLFLGTDKDNKKDMHDKGRNPSINDLGQFTKRLIK